MAVSRSSKPLPSSETARKRTQPGRASAIPAFLCLLGLAAISAAAVWLVQTRGWTLYYGDAEAHLNIARRIVDSRTPGYEQIGTVWLPLPHVLMLPLITHDDLWRSGLAGAIPGALCFVFAGLCLYGAARIAFNSTAAGFAGAFLLALNPNLLYLQATPMTEPVFFATVCALLYCTVRFRVSQSSIWVAAAGLAALASTLTRYEGWFLLPFSAIYFLLAAKGRRLRHAILFSAIAGLGPLYWLAHNWYLYGNPLEFYNGPYSAIGIYQSALKKGMARYPGDHDWAKAWLYFRSAATLTAGWPLVWIGIAGVAAALIKRAVWPLLLLALPAAFYVLSLYSSGTPIFVPQLWPHSYYNTRYGLVALPLLALCGAALVALAPARLRAIAAVLIIAAATAKWAAYPRPDAWICWKESQVNSEVRRAWTHEAADYLGAQWRPGEDILTSFGDLAGIYRRAGIPLRSTLHEGNGPAWSLVTGRPEIFLRGKWVVGFSGDKVTTAALRAGGEQPRYDCVLTVNPKGGPVVEIYRRSR